MQMDVAIFGGGCAGLWLLDEVVRRGGRAVLLEADALGRGQTVGAQGIIHGGLKYTLSGLLTGSAAQIREMPLVWRECLAGQREPDLRGVRVRSQECFLWRTDSLRSRAGMIGARFGLRVAPQSLSVEERPAVLAGCPGTVARLDEPVLSTTSLLEVLAGRHWPRLLRVDPAAVRFETDGPGRVRTIHLTDPATGRMLSLAPRHVVFTAGAGNAALRQQVGLMADVMQRRPLHMVLVRGTLPRLNGHSVDGAKTRVTITADTDAAGRMVWQVGGQIAEDGVRDEPAALIARARAELQATIPGLDLTGTEWATYRIDRAEGRTPTGTRPETPQVLCDGNTLTAWPTKLALAPRLAEEIVTRLDLTGADSLAPPSLSPGHTADDADLPADWPRPSVALPPWDGDTAWYTADGVPLASAQRKAA